MVHKWILCVLSENPQMGWRHARDFSSCVSSVRKRHLTTAQDRKGQVQFLLNVTCQEEATCWMGLKVKHWRRWRKGRGKVTVPAPEMAIYFQENFEAWWDDLGALLYPQRKTVFHYICLWIRRASSKYSTNSGKMSTIVYSESKGAPICTRLLG